MIEDAVLAATGAIQSGNLQAGFDLAARALEAGLRHPTLYKLRAASRERDGRLPEAAGDFREALRLNDRDFSAWNGLGLCLARLGSGEEGVDALKHALLLRPDFAPAQLNLGWALEGQGNVFDAKVAYEAALALNPGLARARSALAMLATRRGDWAAAKAHGLRALVDDPSQTSAALALAITAVHDGDSASVAEDRLQELLSGQLAGLCNERSIALVALGDLRDKQGRYKEALDAYLTAKSVLHSMYASVFDVPGHLGGSEMLVRILDHYTRKPLRAQLPATSGSPSHVFLLGFPRSGTTLLGQVLNAHPGLVTLEEGERLSDAASAFLVPPGGMDRLDAAQEAELDIYRELYWDRVRASGVVMEGRLLVDKMPTNTLGLPLIGRLFPNSLVVYMTRDPRDVLISCLRQSFAVNPATWELLSPDTAATFLDLSLQLGRLMRTQLGPILFLQSYEALVADFEGEICALAAAIGVDPEGIAHFPGALDVSAIATPSARQISAGLNAGSIGQWRHYADELWPVLSRLEPWVAEMGYPT